MATLATDTPAFTHWSQALPKHALDHIPGEDGWPVLGTPCNCWLTRSGSATGCGRSMATSIATTALVGAG